MNETPESLIASAKSAFEAIKASTGKDYGSGVETLQDASNAFQRAKRELGADGVVDACGPLGMSHIGMAWWHLNAAKLLEQDAKRSLRYRLAAFLKRMAGVGR